ncbi:MAG: hypothetical protein RIM99_03680 [Cyclobacteriaceae bacterium]
MKNIKLYISLTMVILLLGVSNESLAQNDFIVIVNKNVKEESLTQSNIRRIYFGFTTQWQSFEKVKPSYTEINNEAFWKYISTEKGKFKSFWTKRVFSGNGVAPDEFRDGRDVIDFVSRTGGAIGIIPSSAKGSIGPNCKIVSLK